MIMNFRYKDETGKKYGKLKVLCPIERRQVSNGCIIWKCECDCGNITYVCGNNLRFGRVKSCGCTHKKKKGE